MALLLLLLLLYFLHDGAFLLLLLLYFLHLMALLLLLLLLYFLHDGASFVVTSSVFSSVDVVAVSLDESIFDYFCRYHSLYYLEVFSI